MSSVHNEADGRLGTLHTDLQAEMNTPLCHSRRAGEETRREIEAAANTKDIVAAVIGPLFYRHWHSREEIADHFLKQVVKNVTGRLKASATQ